MRFQDAARDGRAVVDGAREDVDLVGEVGCRRGCDAEHEQEPGDAHRDIRTRSGARLSRITDAPSAGNGLKVLDENKGR